MKRIIILLVLFLLAGCKEKTAVLKVADTDLYVGIDEVETLREKGFEIYEHGNMDKREKLYLDEVSFDTGRVSMELANTENVMMSFERCRLISFRIYPSDYDSDIYLNDVELTESIDENCKLFKGRMNDKGCKFSIGNLEISLNRNIANKDKNYLDNIFIEYK